MLKKRNSKHHAKSWLKSENGNNEKKCEWKKGKNGTSDGWKNC